MRRILKILIGGWLMPVLTNYFDILLFFELEHDTIKIN